MMRPLILALSMLVSSVAAQPQNPPAAKAPAPRYACPMKCEGDKTYDAEGKCPVCHMALKPVAAPAFSLALSSAGGPPKGNENTLYSLRVVDAAGATVSELAPIDGVKLNLYIVLRDLSSFAHLQPQQQASAEFRFEQTLPPGEYMAYATFQPAGGSAQVLTTAISVAGKAANPRAMGVDADRPRTVDGVTVSLDGFQGARAGQPVTLTVKLVADGKDAEPISGQAAAVVLISHDRRIFLPAVPGPGSTFAATPPAPGLYRAVVEFKRSGKTSVAGFNFEVAESK